MRLLLWHGWLLDGTGSNVYTAKVAEAWRRAGHDVAVVCQEGHPDKLGWADAWGTCDAAGVSDLRPLDPGPAAGRAVVLRPDIGPLLPVFVYDEYEGFEVRTFVDLSDAQLSSYLERNVAALAQAVQWHRPDVVVAGHAVPGPVIARRTLGAGRYAAKVHGSDLEYAIKLQPRYAELAREGLEGATAVTGATHDVLARAVEVAPAIADRIHVVAPGVEIERFLPMDRRAALDDAARRLDVDPDTARGRRSGVGHLVEGAVWEEAEAELSELASLYDQGAPDADGARRLRELAANREPLIGYIGKLIPQKGVDLLLGAVARLPRSVRLAVVGFGTFREWLTALTFALDAGNPRRFRWVVDQAGMAVELTDREVEMARGFWGRVTFTGRLDHRYAPQVLAALDVLAVPSILEEAFGMVAAEGAAAGALPLVARHSGLAEVAGALEGAVGRPGLFSFDQGPGATERLAEGLQRLLSLPHGERAELRHKVSAFARSEWTWDRTAGGLLAAAAG